MCKPGAFVFDVKHGITMKNCTCECGFYATFSCEFVRIVVANHLFPTKSSRIRGQSLSATFSPCNKYIYKVKEYPVQSWVTTSSLFILD